MKLIQTNIQETGVKSIGNNKKLPKSIQNRIYLSLNQEVSNHHILLSDEKNRNALFIQKELDALIYSIRLLYVLKRDLQANKLMIQFYNRLKQDVDYYLAFNQTKSILFKPETDFSLEVLLILSDIAMEYQQPKLNQILNKYQDHVIACTQPQHNLSGQSVA